MSHKSAVCNQGCSCHITRGLRRQKQCRFSNLTRFPHPPHRDGLGPDRGKRRLLDVRRQWRGDEPGANGIDPDVLACVIKGERPRVVDDGSFRRVVCEEPWVIVLVMVDTCWVWAVAFPS